MHRCVPQHPCDNFLYGFKGAVGAPGRSAEPRPVARALASPGGITQAWRRPARQQRTELTRGAARSGAAALPAASALDGARRGRLPRVRSPASARAGQLAATRPSATGHGMSDRASDPRQSA